MLCSTINPTIRNIVGFIFYVAEVLKNILIKVMRRNLGENFINSMLQRKNAQGMYSQNFLSVQKINKVK